MPKITWFACFLVTVRLNHLLLSGLIWVLCPENAVMNAMMKSAVLSSTPLILFPM